MAQIASGLWQTGPISRDGATHVNPNALVVAESLGISKATQKMIFSQSDDATISERIKRSRAAVRRVKAALAKTAPKQPAQKLLTVSKETRERIARSKASIAKARAMLAKPAPGRRLARRGCAYLVARTKTSVADVARQNDMSFEFEHANRRFSESARHKVY